MPSFPALTQYTPVVASEVKVIDGSSAVPLANLIGPVMLVSPLAATDPVSAVAISVKSELTDADEMVVPGTNAATGSVYVPDPLRGMAASYYFQVSIGNFV